MRASWLQSVVALRESPGFHLALFGLGGLLLAVLAAWVDTRDLDRWLAHGPWGDLTSAATGRAVFPTLAAACITVAGVTFSITVVGLLQVGAQHGPRLLGSFLRAAGTQVVLGLFLGTFVYLLGVIGRIDVEGPDVVQPRLAVLLGLVLAVASFSALIYFFHHMTRFFQVPRILDQVTRDMLETLGRVFSEEEAIADAEAADAGVSRAEPPKDKVVLRATRSGYVQLFDEPAALRLAAAHEVSAWILVRPGDFVLEGEPAIALEHEPDDADQAHAAFLGSLTLGRERTRTQDPEFAIDQVSEMAVRALSPGINDPGTAIRCVDRLGVGLLYLADRRTPPSVRRTADGRYALHVRRHDHAGMVKTAFARIRQNAGSQLAVLIRLVETIERLLARPMPGDMRRRLVAEAAEVLALADSCAESGDDRDDVGTRRRRLEKLLSERGERLPASTRSEPS